MHPRHHTSGRTWAVNLSGMQPVAAPVQQFALDLPGEQKFGLVFLVEGRIHTAQNSHIRDVTNGLWPTRRLTDFLNEVAPLKFDFAAGGPDPGAVSASVAAAASGDSAEAAP